MKQDHPILRNNAVSSQKDHDRASICCVDPSETCLRSLKRNLDRHEDYMHHKSTEIGGHTNKETTRHYWLGVFDSLLFKVNLPGLSFATCLIRVTSTLMLHTVWV